MAYIRGIVSTSNAGFHRRALLALFVAIGICVASVQSTKAAQPIDCSDSTAEQCALKVKSTLIDSSTTAEQALAAWGAWTEIYEAAYRGMKNSPVPPSDLDRFESGLGDKIGSLTNPTQIALDLAIERYFPRLATILAVAEGPVAVAVMTFLAPSPTVTPLQELHATNQELSRLLWLKIEPWLFPDWRKRYNGMIQLTLDGQSLPKP